MDGHGTYYYADGAIYTGENKNDLANGFGKLTKRWVKYIYWRV